MNIGLIVDPYGEKQPSGLGRSIFEIAKAVIVAGTDHIFTVFVKRRPIENPDFLGSNWTLKSLKSTYMLLTGARYIDRTLDVYIFFTPIIPLFWRPKRSIVFAMDFAYLETASSSVSEYIHKKFLYYAHRRALRLASIVVAISHQTAQSVVAHFGIPEEKMRVIHIGYLSPSNIQKPLSVPDRYFLFAGVLKERKNVVGIIRAFALFRKSGMDDFYLLLSGKCSGTYYESLVALVEEFDLNERIRFLGYVSDEELSYLYRKATALVFPSFIEGFGMPILEAMHVGLPVITSSTGALAEVAGGAALLVDPARPEDIAIAMARIAIDKVLHQELKEKGLLRAVQFSWKKTAREILEVLAQMSHRGVS